MNHVIAQGEHLSRIALQYGFSDYRTIWDHPQNAALKHKRVSPNVLFPGDQLFIPDKEKKEEPRPTDQRHRFTLKRSTLKLVLVLEDLYEKPLANVSCDLIVESEIFKKVADGTGRLAQEIPATAESGRLIVHDPGTPIREVVIPIKIGHLDPVEEESGQTARLDNLGYFASSPAGASADEARQRFKSAVEEFQCDHNLVVDGVCGPRTQATLKEAHGS